MLMKKIAYLLAGMTMAAWISGCSTPEIVTEDVGATYSAAFYEGGEDSLVMEISLEWPVSGLPAVAMENIQKGLISNIFGKDYSALGIEQAIGRYLQEETETYRSNSSDFMKMIQKNEDDIMTGMFSWVETADGKFLPPYMNMQSYILSTYDYTGGAHGIDAEKGMTFDLGTQSSAATIPVTLEQSRKNGVSADIAGFVIPLCATIHLSGSTLKIVACALALMIMQGMPHDFPLFAGFIFMLGITMVAAPGVPGGAIMASLGILQSMLGFDESAQALMIALYIAMDSFGTACNVTGDGAIALIIDKVMGKK